MLKDILKVREPSFRKAFLICKYFYFYIVSLSIFVKSLLLFNPSAQFLEEPEPGH